MIQLEEVYGEGCITVDDIIAAPTLREVASCLPGATGAPAVCFRGASTNFELITR